MPRTYPLLDLFDAIIASWEGLTPPDYARKAYRSVDKLEDGASAHRDFTIDAVQGGGKIAAQGTTRWEIEHQFLATVRLHLPERASLRRKAKVHELIELGASIWRLTRPAGVLFCVQEDYRFEEFGPDGETDLVLTYRARTQEAILG